MLVLSRRLSERIMIGDDIEITVVQVRGGKVRLGIKAPRGKVILRGELVAALASEDERNKESEDREAA